jgi:hypothetical protein
MAESLVWLAPVAEAAVGELSQLEFAPSSMAPKVVAAAKRRHAVRSSHDNWTG